MKNSDILKVIRLQSVDSTNLEAKRLLQNGLYDQTLIIANEQTAGRGRLGRSFYSPKNTGIYFSYIYFPKDNQSIVNITARAAVSVAKVLENLCGISPEIKWVNDIYLNGKKVCGILCEAVNDVSANAINAIIVGIGINITTEAFPDEISSIAGSLNSDINPQTLAVEIAENLKNSIEISESFLEYYKRHSLVLGKSITFIENGVSQEATAIGIDDNAGLIIKLKNGKTRTLSTGEISIKI